MGFFVMQQLCLCLAYYFPIRLHFYRDYLSQVSTFADMEGEETFEPSFLGTAEEVVEERISDDAVIMIKGTKTSGAVSS